MSLSLAPVVAKLGNLLQPSLNNMCKILGGAIRPDAQLGLIRGPLFRLAFALGFILIKP
jgi:hypothetical protein